MFAALVVEDDEVEESKPASLPKILPTKTQQQQSSARPAATKAPASATGKPNPVAGKAVLATSKPAAPAGAAEPAAGDSGAPRRDDRGRQPREGGGGPHGGRSYGAAGERRPRQHDGKERKSGTGYGRREGDKKETHGKGNWGTAGEGEASPATETGTEEPKKESEKPAEEAKPTPAPEPEDTTQTLAEYRKQQAELAAKVTPNKLRNANEGEDSSQWKGAKQLIKPEEEFYSKATTATRTKKEKEKKTVEKIDIEAKPYHEVSREKFRQERGDNNNRGPRGAPRERKPEVPQLVDANFPALAPKAVKA